MATTANKTVNQLLNQIKELGEYDDWRDVFEAIHNWGYNTDFTYNPITDTHRTSVIAYLRDFIADIYND